MNMTPATFAQNPLNRLDHLRDNTAYFFEESREKHNRFMLIKSGKVVVRTHDQNAFFTHEEIAQFSPEPANFILLGQIDNAAEVYFTTDEFEVTANLTEFDPHAEQQTEFTFIDLRFFAGKKVLPEELLGITAQANSVLNWHKSHQFCSNCGHKSDLAHAGWRRDCVQCETQHFPRTDPVVIMLVTSGNRCLLGRGHHFPEGSYSCLAGFMESGETIENAARRELFEEVGIKGGDVNYMQSQPWPFPTNLMIGVQVAALGEQITLDSHELEDAIWVTKEQIIAVLNGDKEQGFFLPPRLAIARGLVEAWVVDAL